MTLLQHQQVQIIKGVPPIAAYTLSAEQPLVTINLMSDVAGFSLDNDDPWTPAIAQVKGGGDYLDAPLTDGRILQTAVMDNVTENIKVVVSGTCDQIADSIASLGQMRQNAHNFWQTEYQIEPVYLKWWAYGATYPQYALIYLIDFEVTYDDGTETGEVALTIEREPYWRINVPPGANPKLWTLRDANPSSLTTADWALNSGTNHLIYGTVQNRREWNVGQTAPISVNYIDVPATSIPGDAPALLYLHATPASPVGNDFLRRFWMSRKTTPTTLQRRNGTTALGLNILNAADGSGTSLVTPAYRAPIGNNTAATQYVSRGGATNAVSWSSANFMTPDITQLRGQYSCILRLVTGNANSATVTLTVSAGSTALGSITRTISYTGGTSTDYSLLYLGQIDIPFNEQRSASTADGLGIYVNTGNLVISVAIARTAGAANSDISDLILIPTDEPTLYMNFEYGGTSLGLFECFQDNTGYTSHGAPTDAFGHVTTARVVPPADMGGQLITLLPGFNNRLYFLSYATSVGATQFGSLTDTADIRGNIVPRCTGACPV